VTPVVTSSVQQESELTSHPQFVEFVMNFSITFPEKKNRNTVFTHVIVGLKHMPMFAKIPSSFNFFLINIISNSYMLKLNNLGIIAICTFIRACRNFPVMVGG
jgi:hypothetical protein